MESATDQFIAKGKTYMIIDDILYTIFHKGIKYMRREMCFMAIQEARNRNSREVDLIDYLDNSSIKVVVENLHLSACPLHEDGRPTRFLWFPGPIRIQRQSSTGDHGEGRGIESDIMVLWYGTGRYSFTRVCRPSNLFISNEKQREIRNSIIVKYIERSIYNSFYLSIPEIKKRLLCTSDADYAPRRIPNVDSGPFFTWKGGDKECVLVKKFNVGNNEASVLSDLSKDDDIRNIQKQVIEEMLVNFLKVDSETFLSKEEVQWYFNCKEENSFEVHLITNGCVLDEIPESPEFPYSLYAALGAPQES